jgi:hypothetical protein
MSRFQLVQGLLFVVSAGTLGAACTDEATPEQPVGTFQASERSIAELGVSTWEVFPDDADFRIVGRDASASRQLELRIQYDDAAPDERVRIETVFPERGTFHLLRDGTLEGATSELAQRVGAIVQADLNQADLNQGTVSSSPGDGFGTTTSALSIAYSNTEYMGWNLWGYSRVITVGGWCESGKVRDFTTVAADYGAYSTPQPLPFGWVSALNTDCTARFYLSVQNGHYDTFRWFIYATP